MTLKDEPIRKEARHILHGQQNEPTMYTHICSFCHRLIVYYRGAEFVRDHYKTSITHIKEEPKYRELKIVI